MPNNPAARLLAGAAAAVIAAGTGLGLAATAADAASTTHLVKYSCKVPVVGTETVTGRVTLVSPAKSSVGSKVKLVVQLQPGLPAVAVTNLTVKSTLRVSGAQKGKVTVSEFLRRANSGNLKLILTGTLKLTKTGFVHLTAGPSATFALTSSIIGKATLTCTAKSPLPMIGSIAVTKSKRHAPVTVSRNLSRVND